MGARGFALTSTLAISLLAAARVSAFTSFEAPFTGAQDLVTDLPTCPNPGAVSITIGAYGATSDAANLFISDIWNGVTYRTPLSGGSATTAANGPTGFDVGVLFFNGNYFGTGSSRATGLGAGNEGLYTFDGTTLARGSRINPPGQVNPRQVAGDPLSVLPRRASLPHPPTMMTPPGVVRLSETSSR